MMGLNHFAIADEEHHDSFQDLAIMSENLDKEDFLETSYFVNERELQKRVAQDSSTPGRGASSSQKGKEKVAPPAVEEEEEEDDDDDDDEDEEEEEEEDTAMEYSSQGGEDAMGWSDPILLTFPNAAETAINLGDPIEGSGARDSSASVGERVNLTPCSIKRRSKKRRKVQPSDIEAEKREQLLQLLLAEREMKEKKKNPFSELNLPELIADIAKGIYVQMNPLPVQARSPSPSNSLLLLESSPATGSVHSARPSTQHSVDPSVDTTTSDQHTHNSAPQLEGSQVQPIEVEPELARPEGDGIEDRSGCSPSPSSPQVQLELS
jgi:hypothetical protein